MEERPSDSQNESANELPQSVPQAPSPASDTAGETASTQGADAIVALGGITGNETTDQPATHNQVYTEQLTDKGNQETDLATESGEPRLPNQPAQERSRQERPREGQPRQNQPGQPGSQPPKQNQPRNDRSGQDKTDNDRSSGQARQQNAGQPRQPNNQRDPNQPPKQGQSGTDNAGQSRQQNGQQTEPEKQGREHNNPPKQHQPGNDRPGQERPSRQNSQPRDTKPNREMNLVGLDDDVRVADTRPPDRSPTGPREDTTRESDNRLTIGITLGDYNGIGPEVILKALQNNRLQKICTPVIYGSMRVLNRYRNLLEMKDWNLNGIQLIEQASHKLTNVITCWPDQNQEIQPGKVTAEAGQAAFACLQRAVDDLRDGKLDAIVTAPINKHNIQSEEFKFPGHTEYLAEAFGVTDNLMFLVSERLRVGVVTGHLPLGRVRQNITRERILQKWTMMNQSLRLDFGIDKPRIAVLGLNPHAGEEGLLGNEEQEIVKPLIKQLQDKGNLVYGPFPADGFFGTRAYLKFDAVLAMYHDQGLIPFKAIAFEEGVNFTAAMPVVRTSPDHGTAYDIAGKNLADETSMLQAIYTACDIARLRRETAEINAGALKPKRERAPEK